MDCLCHASSLIASRSRETPNPTTNPKPKQLLYLPPELITTIAEFLCPVPASCLALCNRQFSHILGPTVWPTLKLLEPEKRLEFLSFWQSATCSISLAMYISSLINGAIYDSPELLMGVSNISAFAGTAYIILQGRPGIGSTFRTSSYA